MVDARSERVVDWDEMWDGTTPKSVALLGVMVVVA